MKHESFVEKLVSECIEVSPLEAKVHPQRESECRVNFCLDKQDGAHLFQEKDKKERRPFELYKLRTTLVVRRKVFVDVVCRALSEYKYMGPNQRADLVLSCRYNYHFMIIDSYFQFPFPKFYMKTRRFLSLRTPFYIIIII